MSYRNRWIVQSNSGIISEKIMQFPVLQIQSAQGPFYFMEEYCGIPSTWHAIPIWAQTYVIKDKQGKEISQIIIPQGFSIVTR